MPRTKDGRPPSRDGFTLLELVIIMLFLGILVMLGMPALNASLVDARLSAGVSEVSTALGHARHRAMTSKRPCRVTVSTAADTVTVEQIVYVKMADLLNGGLSQLNQADVDQPGATTWKPLPHPLKPGSNYVVDFHSADRSSTVDIVSVVFGAGFAVEFDAFGTPSDGGQVTLAHGGRQGDVKVDADTGRITQSI